MHSNEAETSFKLSLLLLLLHQCKDRFKKIISTNNHLYTHLTLVHQGDAIHIISGICYRIPFFFSSVTISFQYSFSFRMIACKSLMAENDEKVVAIYVKWMKGWARGIFKLFDAFMKQYLYRKIKNVNF